MKFRIPVVQSIFRRNLSSYFSGVLGYLLIVMFVVATGFFAFGQDFFAANKPNLDQLSSWFPVLLLFFIPAITMSVWAEEKKMGTDELLFTLPATAFEVLMGKYFAVLAVYTVTLVFAMTHAVVLGSLGNPDWGLIVATYFGYWVAGGAMLSAGMVASYLTANTTVAFVLGVVICLLPVFFEKIGALLASIPLLGSVVTAVGFDKLLSGLSISEQLREFGLGVIPFKGILFFLSVTAVMLYINYVLLTRRHWGAKRDNALGAHYSLRTISLAVVLGCVTAWAGYLTLRVDATSEKLYTLADATQEVLRDLDSERPIEIQAFISEEVPADYVDTRKRLLGLLSQFDGLAGKNLEVRYVDVKPFSDEAADAERFDIEPQPVRFERRGRSIDRQIYMGAVIISSYDKVTIPFFGKGLPIEYELTRSVQTVANENRLTVGVLNTDANVISGSNGWQIVTELKKQYNVEEVSPDTGIDAEKFDVLFAPMPSSLTDPQMNNLVAYAKSGSPLLVFDDPFPLTLGNQGMGITAAPRQPKPSPQQNPMMGQSPPPEQKADGGRATRLLDALGINWQFDACVFDVKNPHAELANLPKEYVFVTDSDRDQSDDVQPAFNPDVSVSRGLQEIVALYAGSVSRKAGADVDFMPLISTSVESGVMDWSQFVDESQFNFFSRQMSANPKQNPYRLPDTSTHAIAAQVKGDKVNAIFVSDIDMISDWFFQERNLGRLDIKFDNVTFVLNAVDALAGEETYIDLRSRRATHRSLKTVEKQRSAYEKVAYAAEREADEAADEELEARREELSERVKEIEADDSLDALAKEQKLAQAQQFQQTKMSVAEANIQQEKSKKIREVQGKKEQKIDQLEGWYQFWSILLPAIPPLCIGIVVFTQRWSNENNKVDEKRRRKK